MNATALWSHKSDVCETQPPDDLLSINHKSLLYFSIQYTQFVYSINTRDNFPWTNGNYLLLGRGGNSLVSGDKSLHELLAVGVLLGELGLLGLGLLGDDGEPGALLSQLLGEAALGGVSGVQLLHDLNVVGSALAGGSLLGSHLGGSDNRLDLLRVDDGGQIGVGHLRSQQSVSALHLRARLVVAP